MHMQRKQGGEKGVGSRITWFLPPHMPLAFCVCVFEIFAPHCQACLIVVSSPGENGDNPPLAAAA